MSGVVYETEHFSRAELICKCGECAFPGMDALFMAMLEQLRGTYNGPLSVSSAYRCPDHNARVSRTGRAGPHTTGKAVDLRVSGREAFRCLVAAAQLVHRDFATGRNHVFSGIGVSQKGVHGSRFIHLDVLSVNDGHANRPWVWSY